MPEHDSDYNGSGREDVNARAERAKRIILLVMFILMLLPFVLVWMTGSLSFGP